MHHTVTFLSFDQLDLSQCFQMLFRCAAEPVWSEENASGTASNVKAVDIDKCGTSDRGKEPAEMPQCSGEEESETCAALSEHDSRTNTDYAHDEDGVQLCENVGGTSRRSADSPTYEDLSFNSENSHDWNICRC